MCYYVKETMKNICLIKIICYLIKIFRYLVILFYMVKLIYDIYKYIQ
jgi:hypothetical protein